MTAQLIDGKKVSLDIRNGLKPRVRALAEVLLAAPLLGIELADGAPLKTDIDAIREEDDANPLWIERQVWLAMYVKLRLSIEHNTAVVFG